MKTMYQIERYGDGDGIETVKVVRETAQTVWIEKMGWDDKPRIVQERKCGSWHRVLYNTRAEAIEAVRLDLIESVASLLEEHERAVKKLAAFNKKHPPKGDA